MSTLILLLTLAIAPAQAGDTETALPVDDLVALGLDVPTTSTHAPGWRASLPGGGLVKGFLGPNEERAKQFYEAQLTTAQAGIWPQADLPELDADQAVGDGTVSLLVRKGPVVLYVRDLEEDALGWTTKILPLLAADEAADEREDKEADPG